MSLITLLDKTVASPKTGPKFEVAANLLAPIKNAVRYDGGSSTVCNILVKYLSSRSDVMCMRSLFILDVLFVRSKEIRACVCEQLPAIAACCSVVDKRGHSTQLKCRSVLRRTKALQLLDKWDVEFGDLYPSLRTVVQYYRDVLQLPYMPNAVVSALIYFMGTSYWVMSSNLLVWLYALLGGVCGM